jgi:hypothetical protein
MSRLTLKQKKALIKPWRAKFDGTCPDCKSKINADRDLVCRLNGRVIHYVCHPDWFPAPMPNLS